MSVDVTGFRGEVVTVTAAGVQVLTDDRPEENDMTTVPDPNGRPDIERPIDLTDTPERDAPGPAPTPEHHPDPVLPSDDNGTPGVAPVD